MCYCLAFTVLVKPSPQACAVQRLWLSLCYCICNASLLVKTNRIARIFSGEKSVPFISPQSQLAITAAIVAPALAVSCTSLVLTPPNADFFYDLKDYVVMKCNIMTGGLVVVFAYNVLLVLLCSIYAFRTRKTPVNFNEAKFIGFSTYTTCVIWIAFLPVYFSTNSSYQVLALCFSSILSATTVVVFLFIPKVYIILITPEKNIRSNSRLRSKSGDLNGFSSKLDSQDLDSESEYKYFDNLLSFLPSVRSACIYIRCVSVCCLMHEAYGLRGRPFSFIIFTRIQNVLFLQTPLSPPPN